MENTSSPLFDFTTITVILKKSQYIDGKYVLHFNGKPTLSEARTIRINLPANSLKSFKDLDKYFIFDEIDCINFASL